MTLGLVSNCWQTQLASGVPLDELIAEASRQGYRAIELRQGSLGDYETGPQRLPEMTRLCDLPIWFPHMQLNLALEFPFLDGRVAQGMGPPMHSLNAGLNSARLVATIAPPHLRLVDLTTVPDDICSESIDAASSCLVVIARGIAALDGVLSIENARQPWATFLEVFRAARRKLGAECWRLKVCYDPVNLLLSGDQIDPVSVTRSLLAEEISMVHLKQRVEGRISTAVCDGDIDWSAQLAALQGIDYAAPYLFEVASHKKLWEYLSGSREYLRRRGLRLAETH